MIHYFQRLEERVVLDVESGAIHSLDEASYQLIPFLTPDAAEECPAVARNKPESEQAWRELRGLVSDGLLFAPGYNFVPPRDTPLKALCLHVAHDCNMRCGYCFASEGSYGTCRGIMSPETACKAVDMLIERSAKRRNLEIDFFGGEPLMAFDTVRKTVEYARALEERHGKRFRFTLTTNGLLLDDEVIAFINSECHNVVLSLDGREETNDAVRRKPGGGGTYKSVISKYKALVSQRSGSYYLRGTFTANNPFFTPDAIHALDEGFRYISFEPVVLNEKHPLAIKNEHIPEIERAYEELAKELLKRDDGQFFHFVVDQGRSPCVYKRLKGCGAGYEYAAVTPEGDIYPCHQYVGRDGYKLGSVLEKHWDSKLSARFSSRALPPACERCWAKYYCGGGCGASNLSVMGDIDEPYELGCRLLRMRTEYAIAMLVKKALRE